MNKLTKAIDRFFNITYLNDGKTVRIRVGLFWIILIIILIVRKLL